MKKALLNLLYKTGGFTPFHKLNQNKFLILTYHRFSEKETPFSVSRKQFAAHLTYLRKHRTILSLNEILNSWKNGKRLPNNTAIITIDDGYSDAYNIAFPVLKHFNVPATLFVVTDFLSGKVWIWTDKMRFIVSKMPVKKSIIKISGEEIKLENDTPEKAFLSSSKVNTILKKMPEAEKNNEIERIAYELKVQLPDLPPETHSPISWQQAQEMDSNGLAIESHTVSHPILPNVSENQLNFELKESKQKLENALQRTIKAFCYPAGGVDESIRKAVELSGYKIAVTTRYGFNAKGENPFLLKRIDAQPEMVHFAQSASGFEDLRENLRGRNVRN